MRNLFLLLMAIVILSVLGTRASSAEESRVSVLGSSAYIDPYGIYHLVGEVRNDVGSTISFVKVIATFYDSSGKVVASDFTFSEIGTLRNGEKSPFEITMLDQSQIAKISDYKLSVSWSAGGTMPADLVLKTGDSYVDNYEIYHLVGEVTNKGDQTTTFVKVAAAFYDVNSHVVMAGFTYTESDIPPGQSSPFEITLSGPEVSKIKSPSVNVQSQQYSMFIASTDANPQVTSTTSPPTSAISSGAIQTGYDASLSTISLVDFTGAPIDKSNIHVGSQMLLTTLIQNNNASPLPFMTLYEIRDHDGITVNLQILSGKLSGSDSMTAGASWIPENKGSYQVRVFAISDFKTFKPLSTISTTTINVT